MMMTMTKILKWTFASCYLSEARDDVQSHMERTLSDATHTHTHIQSSTHPYIDLIHQI